MITLWILYFVIWILSTILFAYMSYIQDKEVYEFTLYKKKYKTYYKRNPFKAHEYKIWKRIFWYLVVWPFWILGLIFIIWY
jgi:hypothetical protein